MNNTFDTHISEGSIKCIFKGKGITSNPFIYITISINWAYLVLHCNVYIQQFILIHFDSISYRLCTLFPVNRTCTEHELNIKLSETFIVKLKEDYNWMSQYGETLQMQNKCNENKMSSHIFFSLSMLLKRIEFNFPNEIIFMLK